MRLRIYFSKVTWPRQASAQRTTVTDKQLQTNTQGQQYKYMKHAYTYETIDSHHKLFFYLFCFIEVTEVTDRRCCSKRNVLFNYALCSVMQATSLQLNNVFVQFWVLCANLCSVMQAPSITLNTKLYKYRSHWLEGGLRYALHVPLLTTIIFSKSYLQSLQG